MRGYKDSNNKFHPIKPYNKVRKSRDQKAKTQGVRLERMKRTNPKTKGGREIKRYVAFSPSSSEAGEWWTSDKLYDLKWIIQDETLSQDTPISRSNRDGHYFYGSLEIYDTKKHPELLKEMMTGDWDSE